MKTLISIIYIRYESRGHSKISKQVEIGAVVHFVNFIEFKGSFRSDEESIGFLVVLHAHLLFLVVGVHVASEGSALQVFSVHNHKVFNVVILGTSLTILDLEI